MTTQEKAIEQLERVSSHLAAIGEKEDYTEIAIQALEQTKWIPCNERLPEKSGKYLCTFGGTNLMGIDYYTTELDAEKMFDFADAIEYIGWQLHNTVAWMPLPEPYREGMEEEE